MPLDRRVDLLVPFAEKNDAKAHGARWDPAKRVWFAPPGADLQPLQRWLPSDSDLADLVDFTTPDEAVPPQITSNGFIGDKPGTNDVRASISLSKLLQRVQDAIASAIPDMFWIRAEIQQLNESNGNQYLHIAERNENGDVVAHVDAVIWRSVASVINTRFSAATGADLGKNIKVLALVRVDYHVQHGLRLVINDIDPSYTIGDLAAKLTRIRRDLRAEHIYDRNKSLSTPVDFLRLAVISPGTSAGLGDFRTEADRLQRARLCSFDYFPAVFQGIDAPVSVRAAIQTVLTQHRQRPFDALVMIRGGGSVSDLAWLNDLALARDVCCCPIPVVTGIGHERDSTILDEVASRRFDTPSKVALFISQTIYDHAKVAIESLRSIKQQVSRIVVRQREATFLQRKRVRHGTQVEIVRGREFVNNANHLIRVSAQGATLAAFRSAASLVAQLRTGSVRTVASAETATQSSRRQLLTAALSRSKQIGIGLDGNLLALGRLGLTRVTAVARESRELASNLQWHATRTTVDAGKQVVESRLDIIEGVNAAYRLGAKALKAHRALLSTVVTTTCAERTRAISEATLTILANARRNVGRATNRVDECYASLGLRTSALITRARANAESYARLITGIGPAGTLKRGFAIVRDSTGTPIVNRESAMFHRTLGIEFYDGQITVRNDDFIEEVDRG